MSKQANPKVVGAFVVGAFALVVIGLLVFGAGNFFSKRYTYVMFFEGSVGGLQVGAPVNFRGVRVGQVTDISVIRRQDADANGNDAFIIPVRAEVPAGSIHDQTQGNIRSLAELIDDGLRAELGMQSFVTGQLSVELSFKPSTPKNLTGLDPENIDREVPTLPSDMDKLRASITKLTDFLSEVPAKDIMKKIDDAVTAGSEAVERISLAIDSVSGEIVPIVNNIGVTVSELRDTVAEAKDRLSMQEGEVFYEARAALTKIESLVADLEQQVDPISSSARDTLMSIRTAANDASSLLNTVDGEIGPLSASLDTTMTSATGAFDKARDVLQDLDTRAGPLIADARNALNVASDVLENTRGTFDSVGKLAANLDEKVGPLTDEAMKAMETARTALDDGDAVIGDLRALITDVDEGIKPMFAKADKVLSDAEIAMRGARSAITGIQRVTSPDAPTITQLDSTLRAIGRAADSLRELTDYLERNPSALLTGKR